MPAPTIHDSFINGLKTHEVLRLREQWGMNTFGINPSYRVFRIVWDIIREPLFILLAISTIVYFLLGDTREAFMMLLAILLISAISLFQEMRSARALQALQHLTEPRVKVVRDGNEQVIGIEELVPGDIIILEEGSRIPADAVIVQSNDLSVNESVITGEAFPVDKNLTDGNNKLFQGTIINSGKCIARITETGINTVMGQLGKSIDTYQSPKTLLQLQMNRFVRQFALFGLVAFGVIFLVNFTHNKDWATSLLFALTLALSAIPEEIPVAFSSFMALGAHKMSRLGIISRQPQIVENLGAVSVICLDKTGTVTENKMEVKTIYDFKKNTLISLDDIHPLKDQDVLFYGVLASEQDPFDAMEKAIHNAYHKLSERPLPQSGMIHEYPLEGNPPMMTHVYSKEDFSIAAAKGAAERILNACRLHEGDLEAINNQLKSLASMGYRVIAVASAEHHNGKFPAVQDDFDWKFEGLLALYDPPKKNVREVIRQFYEAKIGVKLVTGDYPETAVNIAGQIGIENHGSYLTGEKVKAMNTDELRNAAGNINVFARMFPDVKMKLIEALKANGEIVAMTGDGVNDGPALRSASIGIAMGQKGTEVARLASDLILTDDKIDKMVVAISEGRKIFTNLKKAIRYIISIHIPIIFVAALPPVLCWKYPNIFTPIHVIFMELIMGPTCSIFFEREPVEENNMRNKPRLHNYALFTRNELLISVIQGLVIAAGVLLLYYYFMFSRSIEETRMIVFTTLILSNVFLTFANRSFSQTIFQTIKYKNSLALIILPITLFFLGSLHFIPGVQNLFRLQGISSGEFWLCLAVAFCSVMWFELYKGILRTNHK